MLVALATSAVVILAVRAQAVFLAIEFAVGSSNEKLPELFQASAHCQRSEEG